MKRSITFLAILFLFGFSVIAQESDAAPESPVAEIYLAKDDGAGKPGERTESFIVTDVPIYCVVQLSSGRPATVKMNLVAAKVPGVKAETRVVSTSYTTKDLQDRVNFSGRPQGKWVAGEYRADIYVDDELVRSVTFAISQYGKKPQLPEPVESGMKKSRRPRSN